MKERIKKHLGYYLVFGVVQALGLILIISLAGNRQIQLAAVFAMTIFYFVFAIVHHLLDHDLNAKIVVEYALMGCFGLVVSLILFNI